jgi:ankyrin repeat protein
MFYLIDVKGINLNIQDNENRTPLHHAIMRGCIENARALISNGAILTVSRN